MSGNFIVNTPRHKMHALSFQGIMVTDCHHQLCDILRRKLGDEYVLLFAEPSPNEGNQSVDWYTPVQGPVQHLSELPLDRQNVLRDSLNHMAQELRSFANDLQKSVEHTKVTCGNILELALMYPDEDCLFVVGGQPVFTCWGFGPGTLGAEPQDLSRITHLLPPPPPEPDKPEKDATALETKPKDAAVLETEPIEPPLKPITPTQHISRLWLLWWLLPPLLLLLLLWLLFTSFDNRPALGGTAFFHAPLPPFCRPAADATLHKIDALEKDAAVLEKEIADLHARLKEHVAQCTTPVNTGSENPDSKPGGGLDIPEGSDPTTPMNFLQGYWRCETGLVNEKTKEPVVVEFEFNNDGKGTGRTSEKSGDRCSGAAHGEITRSGELLIKLEEQQCKKTRRKYTAVEIRCSNSNGMTTCHGKNEDGSTWNARFFKYDKRAFPSMF